MHDDVVCCVSVSVMSCVMCVACVDDVLVLSDNDDVNIERQHTLNIRLNIKKRGERGKRRETEKNRILLLNVPKAVPKHDSTHRSHDTARRDKSESSQQTRHNITGDLFLLEPVWTTAATAVLLYGTIQC